MINWWIFLHKMRYLRDHPDPVDRKDGYGVILLDLTIRDLKGDS
jgi:hypothetical protein